MKISLVFYIFSLLISVSSFADDSCAQKCIENESDCLQFGVRSRSSALHLNEMINKANPSSVVNWGTSKCERSINSTNGQTISNGNSCTEWMSHLPSNLGSDTDGTRTFFDDKTIAGELKTLDGSLLVLKFASPTADFSWFFGGDLIKGGGIKYISRIQSVNGAGTGRLLISTTDGCFSID